MKPVLGLFDNEDGLRDYLAANLEVIEPGLRLIGKNYAVASAKGAAGALDILAKDRHGSFVIIEVKRSDSTARQALHELSKYIAAFVITQHVDEHKLRCFVVSTHWHELDTPLAYFRNSVRIDVQGFELTAQSGVLKVAERLLPPIDSLPKLCPDTRLVQAAHGKSINLVVEELKAAAEKMPVLRAALLHFQRIEDAADLAVLCMWRIPDVYIEDVQMTLGDNWSNSEDAYESEWKEESNFLDWLVGQCDSIAPDFPTMRIGTPEKISSIIENRPLEVLTPLGAWPKMDLVHDLEEMQRCVVAQDISNSGRRVNRYSFNGTSTPNNAASWRYLSAAFISFLGFEPFWQSEIERFLATIKKSADVIFYGTDCRHFQYRVYQHLHHEEAQLSQFIIRVLNSAGAETHVMVGGWVWDGKTCPADASAQLIKTYGSLDNARIAVLSRLDDNRYESAFRAHGFHPIVIEKDHASGAPGHLYLCYPSPRNLDWQCRIEQFVATNASYCQQIEEIYSCIPHEPSAERRPVLIELTGR